MSHKLFDKMNNAKPVIHRLPNLQQGTGILAIDKIKLSEGPKGSFIIIEGKVKESASDPTAVGRTGQPELANAAGTRCQFMKDIGPNDTYGYNTAEVVDFFRSLDNYNEAEDGKLSDLVARYTDANNPGRGFEIKYSSYVKKGKAKAGEEPKGTGFVKFQWTHVPGQNEATAAANVKFLDSL